MVADEYEAVTAQVDALYNTAGVPGALPPETETAAMTRLRQDAHAADAGQRALHPISGARVRDGIRL